MKIALLEAGTSHDECLYSQIRFIKNENEHYLTLIANRKIEKNIQNYNLVDEIELFDINNGLKQFYDLWKIRSKIIKGKYKKVIINTAQSSIVKNLLLLPFPKDIEFYGVLHNTKKLVKSFSQKIINRKIKNYYVLSDYLLDKANELGDNDLLFESFYPIFFPKYIKSNINKDSNEKWITIPGNIEFKRRDYLSMFNSIEKNGMEENTKFILLGNINTGRIDAEIVKQKIEELNLQNNFITFDSYVDIDTYYSYLDKTDYILPLIHFGESNNTKYKFRISGAFNLAIGFKIPMIMESNFKDYDDFSGIAYFYDNNNMMPFINNISSLDKNNFYNENKWNFDYQRKRYMNFLMNNNK